jgi:hypothetical protein
MDQFVRASLYSGETDVNLLFAGCLGESGEFNGHLSDIVIFNDIKQLLFDILP